MQGFAFADLDMLLKLSPAFELAARLVETSLDFQFYGKKTI
jgi:hypothetical protein